jgi:hypothetical protein
MEIPSFLVHFCRGTLEIPHVLNRGGGINNAISQCIWQWKHKLKETQLFVARQLVQSGKQDKTFTCRHDIHLRRASGQVLSYTSDLVVKTRHMCLGCFQNMMISVIVLFIIDIYEAAQIDIWFCQPDHCPDLTSYFQTGMGSERDESLGRI